MSERDGTLPHYAVEVDALTAAAAHTHPHSCPVCMKTGSWQGERFVPASEHGPPRCYCRTIFAAGPGAYAYVPGTKTFLRRAHAGDAGGAARGAGVLVGGRARRVGNACPDCGGGGLVEDQEEEEGFSACVLCGGTGVVE